MKGLKKSQRKFRVEIEALQKAAVKAEKEASFINMAESDEKSAIVVDPKVQALLEFNMIQEGHLEVLKWARAKGCDWNPNTCKIASAEGHLDVLRWAVAHGCPWESHVCVVVARFAGHKHVIDWISATEKANGTSVLHLEPQHESCDESDDEDYHVYRTPAGKWRYQRSLESFQQINSASAAIIEDLYGASIVDEEENSESDNVYDNADTSSAIEHGAGHDIMLENCEAKEAVNGDVESGVEDGSEHEIMMGLESDLQCGCDNANNDTAQ